MTLGAAVPGALQGCAQVAGLDGNSLPFRDAAADTADAPEMECQPGRTMCGTPPGQYCADLMSDPDNCGACGNQCPSFSHARASCSGGTCQAGCDIGWVDADGSMEDGCECMISGAETCDGLDNDCSGLIDDTFACAQGSEEDCTPPGTACPGIRTCTHDCAWDVCLAVCSAGMTCCPSGCVNILEDPENCGACGFSCSGHGACNAGSCVCTTGYAGLHCERCARSYIGYPNCHEDPPTGSCQCQEADRPGLEICGNKDCVVMAGTVDGCGGCGGAENRCCACRACTVYMPLPLECSDAGCSCKDETGECPPF